MADYNNYKRPQFYKKKHPIRNFFIVLVILIVVALSIFIYMNYSTAQKTTTPIEQKTNTNSTIEENSDSTSENSSSSDDSESSDSEPSTSESSSSSSSSSSSNVADSAHLNGKKISEAIAWAKENRRTYSWNIISGGNDAIVTQITDDGQNISFTASANQ